MRVDPPMPAVVIGDSAISALRWAPGADNAVIGFEHTLDLESCRRLYIPSCHGREVACPRPCSRRSPSAAVEVCNLRRRPPDTGRGRFDDGDVVPEHRPRARALGYKQVVWWTLRADVDYVAPDMSPTTSRSSQSNQIVRDLLASGACPDVVLADWNAYTHKQDSFVTDGVRYRQLGAWARRPDPGQEVAFLQPLRADADPGRPAPPEPVSRSASPGRSPISPRCPIGPDRVLCCSRSARRPSRGVCRLSTHVVRLTRCGRRA